MVFKIPMLGVVLGFHPLEGEEYMVIIPSSYLKYTKHISSLVPTLISWKWVRGLLDWDWLFMVAQVKESSLIWVASCGWEIGQCPVLAIPSLEASYRWEKNVPSIPSACIFWLRQHSGHWHTATNFSLAILPFCFSFSLTDIQSLWVFLTKRNSFWPLLKSPGSVICAHQDKHVSSRLLSGPQGGLNHQRGSGGSSVSSWCIFRGWGNSTACKWR